jgi:hypothetical protein
MSASDGGFPGHLKGSYTGERGDPARFIVPITISTGSTGLPDGACRAIQSISSGTISFMDPSGSTIDNFPIRAFENPIGVKAIYSSVGTTAIWALY